MGSHGYVRCCVPLNRLGVGVSPLMLELDV